ncbi:hypothetical protein BS50DRAFT_489322 [Corynespora cassiicola Philippines]|uniref:Zn(2)-C6 fungal-type domain-containing protein n=1 Tax=Corynespora cassiicola Philippines TaxID=1448308 RepID=A0A2T2NVR5_CORCC|nr:hypothetical protein BS50DRAFT_489322 [Corynespora cassiicola Philippines]
MPIQRSRGGCHTCKKRKRKCDETRPECRACQSRGNTCGGYDLQLRWNSSYPSPTAITVAERSEGILVNNRDEELRLRDTGLMQSSSLSTPCTVVGDHADEVEQQAFQRFLSSGVHALYATTINAWIKPLIAEHSRNSSALLIVCANIQILIEEGSSLQFHSHFDRALKIFQVELFASNGAIKPPTLGAGLLLCTLSLLQGLQWTQHLLCMADLYDLRGDLNGLRIERDMYTRHCLEVMGVMDLPNLVLGRHTQCMGFWKRLRKVQDRWSHYDMDGVEPISGIPRSLLDICARIDEPAADSRFWLWQGVIGEFTQCHLWDAWRFAGMLDHRRRWRPSSVGATHPPTGVILPSSTQLMFRLLSALDALRIGLKQKENSHMLVANATLYPWFVASTEVGILNEYPSWMSATEQLRDDLLASDSSQNSRILMELVSDIHQSPDQSLDIERSLLAKSVEIALF